MILSMAGHFVSWKTTEQVELQCPDLLTQYATPSNDIAEFILAFTAGQTIEETNSTAKPAELVHLLEFAGAVRGLAGIEPFKRRKGAKKQSVRDCSLD